MHHVLIMYLHPHCCTGAASSSAPSAPASCGLQATALVPLPPGAVGTPLHWSARGAARRMLCVSLPGAAGGAAAASAAAHGLPPSAMWAEPLAVTYPNAIHVQVRG